MPAKPLGEMLVESGLITRAQLEEALRDQKNFGGRIGAILFEKCQLNEKDYLRILSARLGVPAIDFRGLTIPGDVIKLVPKDLAWEKMILPVRLLKKGESQTLLLAMADPTDRETQSRVRMITKLPVRPALAVESTIRHILMEYYDTLYGQGDYKFTDNLAPACDDSGSLITDLRTSEPSSPVLLLGRPDEKKTGGGDLSAELLLLEEQVFADPLNAMPLLRRLLRALLLKKVISPAEYRKILKDS